MGVRGGTVMVSATEPSPASDIVGEMDMTLIELVNGVRDVSDRCLEWIPLEDVEGELRGE